MIPRLFAWPPVRAARPQALERPVVGLLVASTIFLLATGHREHPVLVRLRLRLREGALLRGGRVRGGARRCTSSSSCRWRCAHTARAASSRRCAQASPRRGRSRRTTTWSRPRPDPPTISPPRAARRGRRRLAALLVANAGESLGGPLRDLAVLAPRRAGGFPVNKTRARRRRHRRAWSAPPTGSRVAAAPRELELTLDELLALPQATHTLTLGCVEGWSTRQSWTGVPLRELARRAGVPEPARARGRLAAAEGRPARRRRSPGGAVADPRSLLALQVGRRAAAARPRLPGTDHRAGAARRAQHEVGRPPGAARMRPAALVAHVAALAPRRPGRSCSCSGWAGASTSSRWLLGAVIVHDALIWPAYTGADRAARRGRPAGWSNFVRVPLRDLGAARARLLPDHARQGRGGVHARERARVGRLRAALARS